MKKLFLGIAILSLVPVTSVAQDVGAVRAELIERAQRARERGNHREAVDIARRAAVIEQTPSLHAFIAVESLEVSEFAEAYENALLCRRGFQLNPNLPTAGEFLAACEQVMSRAQGRVGRIILEVPAQRPASLVVRIAQREVPPAVYGVPFIVNPGNIAVEITAPGYQPHRTTIDVGPGVTSTIPFQLGSAIESNRPISPGPFVVLGVGAVGFIASGVLFAFREGAFSQLRTSCDPQLSPNDLYCRDSVSVRQQFASVETFTAATNTTIAISTVVSAAGIAWLIIDRVTATPRRTNLSIAPSPSGMLIQGSF